MRSSGCQLESMIAASTGNGQRRRRPALGVSVRAGRAQPRRRELAGEAAERGDLLRLHEQLLGLHGFPPGGVAGTALANGVPSPQRAARPGNADTSMTAPPGFAQFPRQHRAPAQDLADPLPAIRVPCESGMESPSKRPQGRAGCVLPAQRPRLCLPSFRLRVPHRDRTRARFP